MLTLTHPAFLEHLDNPVLLLTIPIGAVISGFFLQWASRIMGIFDTDFSKCFIVSFIGIMADYGIAYLTYVEGYMGGLVAFLISLIINTAIIVGFFKIGWFRGFFLYFVMRILSFIIGCLCCCGVTRHFPSF